MNQPQLHNPSDSQAEPFWAALNQLVAQSELVIDRPKGSTHPRYASVVYPLDYGYLAGTTSGDGQGIDLWLGSDGSQLSAVVCCVDLHKRDVEMKLLIGCNSAEITTIFNFHNRGDQAAQLIKRPHA